MKISYGISSKMGAYIKPSANSGGVSLCTVENAEAVGGAYVYLFSAYVAARTPIGFYKDTFQPFTCCDAPEIGESKAVVGEITDLSGVVKVFEDALNNGVPAVKTPFSYEAPLPKGKHKTVSIFCDENGNTAVANQELLALFPFPDGYKMNGVSGPIVLNGCGDFHNAVDAIVLPIRQKDDYSEVMKAISNYAKAH